MARGGEVEEGAGELVVGEWNEGSEGMVGGGAWARFATSVAGGEGEEGVVGLVEADAVAEEEGELGEVEVGVGADGEGGEEGVGAKDGIC